MPTQKEILLSALRNTGAIATQYQRLKLGESATAVPYPTHLTQFGAKNQKISHVRHMCIHAEEFVENGDVEKAQRWLCFAQGVLWEIGAASIDEFRKINARL